MKKAKILICDDEEGVRKSFEFILREKYELTFACDGPEALSRIQAEPPDLVLLDLKMPKMDGMKVLKEVKKNNPQIKVIIVTGYSSLGTAYRAIKTGASDYIPKPFDQDVLLKSIKKTLKTSGPKSPKPRGRA